MNRRAYLDWLRGIAVLIMIEGHTLDSWTRVADRHSNAYRWAIILAGFGAPVFLFLAGISSILAAGARQRQGFPRSQLVRAAFTRGLWVLGLAFLFRVQSFVISGGTFPQSLLKVDILNIMGIAMLLGTMGLGVADSVIARTIVFGAFTAAVALFTPLVRETSTLGALPDPLEAYLRPTAGLATFSLFPWAAFFTGGAAVGAWLARNPPDEARTNLYVGVLGLVMAAAGYLTSLLPPLYPSASFWTTSPTFFFLRLGVLMVGLWCAYLLSRFWRGPALQQFGRASLFVYWVHVELVYGVLSAPLHRRLPFPIAAAAFAMFSGAMFWLVVLRDRFFQRGRPTQSGCPTTAQPSRGSSPASTN